MPVTLINVFSVPQAKEGEFVKWWQDVADNFTKQQGISGGKFYKSIKPDSKFNFINVAVWESEEIYGKAVQKSVTPEKAKEPEKMGVEMTPALYQVVFEY
ncbi:MAG: antibiotic biosynthesis monooxygenase [Nitrospira sp.]